MVKSAEIRPQLVVVYGKKLISDRMVIKGISQVDEFHALARSGRPHVENSGFA